MKVHALSTPELLAQPASLRTLSHILISTVYIVPYFP